MKNIMDVKRKVREILAKILILCMVILNPSIAYAATQQATAASVKVLRSDGTVEVHNSSGRSVPVVEGMRLYNGYQVITKEASYAYMALDDSKLATLDAVGDMHLERKGDDLALMLNSGSMFFDVSAKLGDEETMNIHTANVSLGIRGTSGLVEVIDRMHTRVYLFDGQVNGSVTNQINEQKKEIRMTPGMVADFYVYDMNRNGDKCDIIVRSYEEGEIPGFVLREMKKEPELADRILQSGGGDFRPYLEQAQERLDSDEAQMHEALESIRRKYNEQPHSDHVIPVFEAEDQAEDSTDGTSGGGSTSTVTYENATLLTGTQINQKFQELLNFADSQGFNWSPFYMNAYAGTADLKAIRYSSASPDSSQYTVTLEASGSPVYAWYQSGTIYLYSDAPKMQLPADCSGMLNGFYNLTDISGLAKFDASNVTNLSSAFSTLRSLTDFSPVSGWDVSNVTDLSYAFEGCSSITDLSALSSWNIGNVTDLSYTFAYNTALTSVSGIRDWNTSSVSALDNIFSGCTNLTDASSLSAHNTGSYMAWDVKATFKNAAKAEEFINTGVAADTSYGGYPDWFMKTYRFIGDDGTTVIYTASIPMDAMDLNAALESQLAANAPEYLKGWNTRADGSGTALNTSGNATLITEDTTFYYQPMEATLITGSELNSAMVNAAGDAGNITAILWSDTAPDAGVTASTISGAGSDAEAVCWYDGGTIYLYGPVRTVYLNEDSSGAFRSMPSLDTITGLKKLDCSKVTNLAWAFAQCVSLEDLSPISKWDISNVTTLQATFYGMGISDNSISALSGWDVSNVTSLENTFGGHSLTDLSALQDWKTGKVESFEHTFQRFYNTVTFNNVDWLSGWNTGSAKTMNGMFVQCVTLADVSGLEAWDVSNVTDMNGMFANTAVTEYPSWYDSGTSVSKAADQLSTLTLDAGTGTVELQDIAPSSVITLYAAPQKMSKENPDPLILEDEYITDAVELPKADHSLDTFDEWNTEKDGSGVSYKAGEVYTLDGETTLYAIWENADISDATPSDATSSDATLSDATPSDATPSDTAPSGAEKESMPDYPVSDAIDEELAADLAALYLENQNQKKGEREDEEI